MYFIPRFNWIQLPYLVCRQTLEFFPSSTRQDVLNCFKDFNQLEINSLNGKKQKDDQTNLDKEGVFQCWNVCFVCYDLHSNVTVFFGLVCTENTRKRLKVSKELACRFELFQFLPVVNWNFSFTHTHMELWHAVTTHQWTRKPVYYNYCITFLSCN